MGSDDWFRKSSWNQENEAIFESKLGRARRTDQYLKIQAHCLIETHPDVSLRLIDRYFDQDSRAFDADAFVIRAEALLCLGQLEEGLDAYELALKRELESPNHKTNAFVDYPFLVATRRARGRYSRALRILEERCIDLVFPVSKFKWNVAQALIHQELSRMNEARAYAKAAIATADLKHSGFGKYASLGLVEEKYASWVRKMEEILTPSRKRRLFGLL